MELDTIQVDPAVARAAYLRYREAAKITGDPEDELCRRVNLALSRGKQVINLPNTIRDADLNEQGLPKLAAVKATAPTCFLSVGEDCSAIFSDRVVHPGGYWAGRTHVSAVFSRAEMRHAVDPGWWGVRFLEPCRRRWGTRYQFEAPRPIVPPEHRPAPWAPHRYWVLWEVDQWAIRDHEAEAPHDPALLKRIGSSRSPLFEVVATWDLTEVERAAMALR